MTEKAAMEHVAESVVRPTDIPFCYKVGCDNEDRQHKHVGPITKGERIVVTPKLVTAPGWAYVNPHGRFLGRDGMYATVALDDGSTRRVSPQNVVRERLWKEPQLDRRLPRPLHRPHKPLDPGPWVELTLLDLVESVGRVPDGD